MGSDWCEFVSKQSQINSYKLISYENKFTGVYFLRYQFMRYTFGYNIILRCVSNM